MRQIILFLLVITSFNITYGRERLNFNAKWRFNLGDDVKALKAGFNDTDWRILDLPHDWSIEGDYNKNNPMSHFCGYLPAGIGWYRKTIDVPAEWKGKHVEIAFDGVFMNSTVWANGRKLGVRPFGWISFEYDISEEVEQSDKITFAVRVDNSKQPAARWYTGSGIYANTWINVREKIHVPNNGVYVRTERNKVLIDTEIANYTGKEENITIVSSILDGSDNIIVKTPKLGVSTTSKKNIATTQTMEIPNPILWDLDKPYLYTLITKISKGETVLDELETRFGVRDIKWIPETGMWINGRNVKMRGVCNHQDAGALGAAVPDKILRFRIKQLKDMGCNAIRVAHNPQTPQFYDMCDEMGMLVMDEIFDGWMQKAENDYGSQAFAEWWNRDLTDWIKRDRNHPSVVIYSIGNETHGEIAKELVTRCHELDETRPVTSGHSSSEYMDVFGVNGASEQFDFFEKFNDDRVFIGTENTHTFQVRGYYRTLTWFRDGYPNERRRPHFYPDLTEKEVFTMDWTTDEKRNGPKQIFMSSYDNAIVRLNCRHNIEKLRDIPHFAGSFRWTGHDYLGEAKYHGGWPFRSLSVGLIDMVNFEKDHYYLYQSQWTEKPMAHILPHWTHPTVKEGTKIPVWVYSNCDEVELFFNGISLGRQKPGTQWSEMQCEWMVGWNPGTLEAKAYKNGKVVISETVSTANTPSRNTLSIDGEPMANIDKDIVQVRVASEDSKGAFYPYGENRTYFHVLGSGKIRALDNGSPMDVEKHFEAQSRIAFYGLTRAYIESTDADGDINLLTTAILGEKKQITSKQVSIDTQLLNIRGKKTNPKVEILYTTDGSAPSRSSKLYKSAFMVENGTAVKALVLLDGKELYVMQERFADDEGFVFNNESTSNTVAGDQAETATLTNSIVQKEGKGFHGKGYAFLGKKAGGSVEWYYENDGGSGEFNIGIRYSASDKIRSNYRVQLTINGESQTLKLPATTHYKSFWRVFDAKGKIKAGANKIRIESLEGDGLCIDEVVVR